MLAALKNWIGAAPDRLLRDGLLLDGRRNRLPRAAYLSRLEFYLQDRFQRDLRFFDGLPRSAPGLRVDERRLRPWGEELLLRFPSTYRAVNPALAGEVAAYVRNRDGYLFLLRHDARPRPLVLCVHGFQMGDPARVKRLFRVERLLALGVDVALFIQPHHWRRAASPRSPFRQAFINPHDVPLTIEALGQAVHDLRSAYRLLESLGYGRVALVGASLGGYVCALHAVVDASAACVFVAVPSLRLDRTLAPRRLKLGFPVDEELRDTTRRALRIVAPATYTPAMAVDDICVVYHEGDRIADAAYTREWIDAWRIPNRVALHGGHWAVFDRKARGRAFYAWLARYGFIPERTPKGARP